MGLRVIRDKPTPRDVLRGLTGRLWFFVEVVDPVHIGGPSGSFGRAESILEEVKGISSVEARLNKLAELANVIVKDARATFSLSRERKPAIPGSSLKGAVRSRLELSFHGYMGEVPSCFSVVGRERGRSRFSWRHQRVYPSSREDRGLPCNFLKYGSVCKVCDIFGAPGLASRVHFPSIIFQCTPETIIFPRVGPMEVIPSGCKAEGSMSFFNMEPYELGLVLIGMGDMGKLLIGFGKYRGRAGDMSKVKLGGIIIKPNSWAFLNSSRDVLERLTEFEVEDGFLIVRDAEKLWKILVSLARERYSDYLREVTLNA